MIEGFKGLWAWDLFIHFEERALLAFVLVVITWVTVFLIFCIAEKYKDYSSNRPFSPLSLIYEDELKSLRKYMKVKACLMDAVDIDGKDISRYKITIKEKDRQRFKIIMVDEKYLYKVRKR